MNASQSALPAAGAAEGPGGFGFPRNPGIGTATEEAF